MPLNCLKFCVTFFFLICSWIGVIGIFSFLYLCLHCTLCVSASLLSLSVSLAVCWFIDDWLICAIIGGGWWQALEDIQYAIKMLKQGDRSENPVDRHYHALECQLAPLDHASDDFKVQLHCQRLLFSQLYVCQWLLFTVCPHTEASWDRLQHETTFFVEHETTFFVEHETTFFAEHETTFFAEHETTFF